MAFLFCFSLASTGCGHLRPRPKTEIVYVLAKQTFLRDRVAAVSNRVATVQNGQQLELIERGRRFLKVKTGKGEIGWIEEHAVVDPEVVAGFEQLQKAHGRDTAVATAALRDDGYLHLKPGRDTDRYYLLPEGDKLQLLLRASVPKAVGPQASGGLSSFARPSAATRKKPGPKGPPPARKEQSGEKKPPEIVFHSAPPPPPPESVANPIDDSSPAEGKIAGGKAGEGEMASRPGPAPAPPAPLPMEDWWLVRDSGGRVGWLMSRRIDVDVPDEIAGYAAGRRMVAAYLLRKIDDPESNFPGKQAGEYITVLNPYQDGLPYDFSQVQVFTWNLKRHRYETAFRLRDLQGYLPVTIGSLAEDKGGASPTFQITRGVGDSVSIDPETGAARPASSEKATYVLEGSLVRKVGPPAAPAAKPVSPREAGPEKKKHRRGLPGRISGPRHRRPA